MERAHHQWNRPWARYGHTAIWDDNTVFDAGVPRRRMIVFGGSSGLVDPSGAGVWELRRDATANSATWLSMQVVDLDGLPDPTARFRHSLTFAREAGLRTHTPTQKVGHVAFLFGGSPTTTTYSDEFFILWIFNDGTVGWEKKTFSGTSPGARASHTAVIDLPSGVPGAPLYVFGGQTPGGPADRFEYTVNPLLATPTWSRWTESRASLSGHTVTLDWDATYARVAETWHPSLGWQVHSSTTLAQITYPVAFATSGSATAGGRVITLGTDLRAYHVDLPGTGQAGGWQQLPNAILDFIAYTGVMYRPNRMMVAGGTTESVVGTTKTLDVSTLTNAWSASGSMTPRTYHNLVILPDGTVLVVGGQQAKNALDFSQPIRQPQIWDPSTSSWGTGLASQSTSRGYHSSAMLLPDGRVLSGGGEYPSDKHKFELFCPPYLFNPGGSLATRPIIWAWSDTVGYGTQFTIWFESPDSIRSVCLIRPGAVTHGFNQDQRYVPLTFQIQQLPDQCPEIVADAPANADVAPPGDYLLFILKKNPFEPSSSGVPAVAQWVRLRSGSTSPIIGYLPPGCSFGGGGGGCPFADTRSAAGWQVENSILGRSPNGALLTDVYRLRHAPAEFGGRYQLRIRENEKEEAILDQAQLVSVDHEPDVEAFATGEGFVLARRVPAYRVTTAGGEDVTAQMSGRGGKFRARPGDVLLVEMLAPGESWSPDGTLLDRRALIADEEKMGPNPGSLRPQGATAASLDALVLERSGILVQVPDGNRGWRTVEHRYPREKLDAAALEGGAPRMRLVFVGAHNIGFIGRMAVVGRATPTEHRLLSARHSRLGDVAGAVMTGVGEITTLVPSDTLELEFEASPSSDRVREFFLMTRGVYTSRPDAGSQGSERPLQFALLQNRPNPFGQTTAIQFELPASAEVRLEIFDLLGRRVKTVARGSYEPGRHTIEWDRTDHRGVRVAPGVYAYRLIAGSFSARKSMVLLP